MLVDYTKVRRIYIVCGKMDLRRGIDELTSIVQTQYELDVYEDALFLFYGTRSDRFKILY